MSVYLKAASTRKRDLIDEIYLSNDFPDDKLSNGTSFIAIVILGVLENIFEICPFKRTNLNSVGLGGLNVDKCQILTCPIIAFNCLYRDRPNQHLSYFPAFYTFPSVYSV